MLKYKKIYIFLKHVKISSIHRSLHFILTPVFSEPDLLTLILYSDQQVKSAITSLKGVPIYNEVLRLTRLQCPAEEEEAASSSTGVAAATPSTSGTTSSASMVGSSPPSKKSRQVVRICY